MAERILSILVEDKPGVLARVALTISRRGFNINSLSVGPTNIEGRSKMTIVTELESVEQVKKQLNKLVNIIKIVELDPDNTIESEVLLMKVSINKETQTSVIEKANLSGAKSVDVGQDYAAPDLKTVDEVRLSSQSSNSKVFISGFFSIETETRP